MTPTQSVPSAGRKRSSTSSVVASGSGASSPSLASMPSGADLLGVEDVGGRALALFHQRRAHLGRAAVADFDVGPGGLGEDVDDRLDQLLVATAVDRQALTGEIGELGRLGAGDGRLRRGVGRRRVRTRRARPPGWCRPPASTESGRERSEPRATSDQHGGDGRRALHISATRPNEKPRGGLGKVDGRGRAEAELLDRLLAHLELLHLAGDRHRELVDDLDVARDLVVGDLALAERPDVLGVEGGADAPGRTLTHAISSSP